MYRPLKNRSTLFYFNGNLGPAYEDGRPEDMYVLTFIAGFKVFFSSVLCCIDESTLVFDYISGTVWALGRS